MIYLSIYLYIFLKEFEEDYLKPLQTYGLFEKSKASSFILFWTKTFYSLRVSLSLSLYLSIYLSLSLSLSLSLYIYIYIER